MIVSENDDAIKTMLMELGKQTSAAKLYGPKGALLLFLRKLDVLAARRGSVSMAYYLVRPNAGTPPAIPPCSIRIPITSTAIEYLEFYPKSQKSKHAEEL